MIRRPYSRKNVVQSSEAEERSKVERPDPQDAADIESLHMDGAGRLPLPHQQLRNQKCAQKKEDRHAKGARRAEVEEPWIARCVECHEIHAVKAEHAQESEESQRIKLRTVVTAQTTPNPFISN